MTNKENSEKIVNAANVKLEQMNKYVIEKISAIGKTTIKYYYVDSQQMAGADFLKDASEYIASRNPSLNEGRTSWELLAEWAERVEFNKHKRF